MGIKPGDVILEVDGNPVSETSGFSKALAEAKKNQIIRLKVQRGNQKLFLAGPLG
jgi:S1-C subfamily serine protease